MSQSFFSCRSRSLYFSKRLFSASSHGGEPSVGEVYRKNFKEFDEQLAKLRLDLITDPNEFDRLHRAGKISASLASHFKEALSHSKESESMFIFKKVMVLIIREFQVLGTHVFLCRIASVCACRRECLLFGKKAPTALGGAWPFGGG